MSSLHLSTYIRTVIIEYFVVLRTFPEFPVFSPYFSFFSYVFFLVFLFFFVAFPVFFLFSSPPPPWKKRNVTYTSVPVFFVSIKITRLFFLCVFAVFAVFVCQENEKEKTYSISTALTSTVCTDLSASSPNCSRLRRPLNRRGHPPPPDNACYTFLRWHGAERRPSPLPARAE